MGILEHLYVLTFIIFILTIENSQSGVKRRSKCPTLNIPNARIRIRAKGRLAKIRCLTGYTMIEGDKRLTCIRQQWKGTVPHCIRSGCGDTPLKNGKSIQLYNGGLVHFECYPGYSLEGSPALICDGISWNSSIPVCQITPPNPDHTSCSFESRDLCGWSQDNLDQLDWRWTTGSLNAFAGSLGAKVDHTLRSSMGHYIYADSKGFLLPSMKARLFSPILPVPIETPVCVTLYYHIYGSPSANLNIYVKPESIPFSILVPSLTVYGTNEDVWKIALIQLSDMEDMFQIIIEATASDRPMVDVAVDDFEVIYGEDCINLQIKIAEEKSKGEQGSNPTSERSGVSKPPGGDLESELPTDVAPTTISDTDEDTTFISSASWSIEPTVIKANSSSTRKLPSTVTRVMPDPSSTTSSTSPAKTMYHKFIIPMSRPPITVLTSPSLVIPLRTTSSSPLERKTLTPPIISSPRTSSTTLPSSLSTSLNRRTTTSTVSPVPSSSLTPLSMAPTFKATSDVNSDSSSKSSRTDHAGATPSLWATDNMKPVQEVKESSTGTAGGVILVFACLAVVVVVVAIAFVLFWLKRRRRRQLEEDVDIRRLKEESRETEPSRDQDSDDNDHHRRPFATSYNRLWNISGAQGLRVSGIER